MRACRAWPSLPGESRFSQTRVCFVPLSGPVDRSHDASTASGGSPRRGTRQRALRQHAAAIRWRLWAFTACLLLGLGLLTTACGPETTNVPTGSPLSRELPEITGEPIAPPSISACGGTVPADYLFDLDSAELRAGTEDLLEEILADIRRAGPRHITVLGYTDGLGTREHNDELSRGRATSVRDWLVREGLDEDRVDARGRGMGADPGVSDPSKRRVEFDFEPGC